MSAATSAKAPTGVWGLRWRGFRQFAAKFARRRDGVVGFAILAFFTLMAISPYWFVGPLETAITASGTGFEPPSLDHLLGTDELGRDVLNLTVHGARVSMLIGLLATVITVLVGVAIGIVSGFVGCCAIRITRQANGITARSGMPGFASLAHVSPQSSLRYIVIGDPPAKIRFGLE